MGLYQDDLLVLLSYSLIITRATGTLEERWRTTSNFILFKVMNNEV